MNTTQKVIKGFAICLAVLIILSIINGIVFLATSTNPIISSFHKHFHKNFHKTGQKKRCIMQCIKNLFHNLMKNYFH